MALYQLDHFTGLYIYGKDSEMFLQGLVTCDVRLLAPNKAQPAACCNLQGQVIAVFYMALWEEGYLLIIPKILIGSMQKHLKKYAVFSKVTLERTANLCFLGVSKKDNTVLPQNINSQQVFQCFDDLSIAICLENPKIEMYDTNAWHYRQLEYGFPDISANTQAKFSVHRIGLQNIEGAVNIKKGCYLGQEIIARTHFKAVFKRSLVLCEILDEYKQSSEDVIDFAFSPNNQKIFLASLKNEHLTDSSIQIIKNLGIAQ